MSPTPRANLSSSCGIKAGLVALALCLPTGGAQAGALTRVMQAMEADYQALSEALLREDYTRAEQAANRLADHPTPSFSEKLALVGRLGTAAGRFRELDSQLKQAATDISAAAQAESLEAMSQGFHRLTDSCLACHRQLGDRVRSEPEE